ncbi:DUF6510 family protein [Homoserinibacter sp. GY 40078]|uniref:DUF6510 family protein n=1 Tax=Homoserinibacter sp. GY 40078 TaxID=2603275 RepID=UPI0021078A15|nr:DUF6510 family protein [Homoserinibacter sp. GY 40078]
MHLDGNAVAGALADAFGRDVTSAEASCGSCGARQAVASASAYVSAMGWVLRCVHCDAVLAVLIETEGHVRMSMAGVSSLDMPVAGGGA